MQQDLLELCRTGNSDEFINLFDSLSFRDQAAFLIKEDYEAFNIAAENNHAKIIEKIFKSSIERREEYAKYFPQFSIEDDDIGYVELEDSVLIKFLSSRQCESFKRAIMHNQSQLLEIFLGWGDVPPYPDSLGDFSISIIKQNDELIDKVWNSKYRYYIYALFAEACADDRLMIEKILIFALKEDVIELLKYGNYESFRSAFYSSNQDILLRLWKLADTEIKEQVRLNIIPDCFIYAVKQGNFKLVQWIYNLEYPKVALECIQKDGFCSFIYAADRGHVDILKSLWENTPLHLGRKEIAASNFAAYRLASKAGHKEAVRFLDSIVPDDLRDVMHKAVNQTFLDNPELG